MLPWTDAACVCPLSAVLHDSTMGRTLVVLGVFWVQAP